MSRPMAVHDTDLLLLDTHVLIWLMFGEARLGQRARKCIADTALEGHLMVSAITPWEIGILVNKKRIDLHQEIFSWMTSALSLPGLSLAALEPEIAVGSTQLPFEMHPDPADRILVATARRLGAVLVTADRLLLDLASAGYFRAMDAQL